MMMPERFCKYISPAWRVVKELAAAGSLLMQGSLSSDGCFRHVRSNDFRDVVVTLFYRAGSGGVCKEPSVHIYGDCDPVPGVPAVVQVIAVFGVNDIHIIVVVPIVRPVLWPWVHETEPKAAVLEPRIPAIQLHRVPVDAEPVIRTKVATITVIWNTVAVVAATLLPVTVLGLPVTCAMLLPHLPLLTWLHPLPLP
jgi:hypothetical protein